MKCGIPRSTRFRIWSRPGSRASSPGKTSISEEPLGLARNSGPSIDSIFPQVPHPQCGFIALVRRGDLVRITTSVSKSSTATATPSPGRLHRWPVPSLATSAKTNERCRGCRVGRRCRSDCPLFASPTRATQVSLRVDARVGRRVPGDELFEVLIHDQSLALRPPPRLCLGARGRPWCCGLPRRGSARPAANHLTRLLLPPRRGVEQIEGHRQLVARHSPRSARAAALAFPRHHPVRSRAARELEGWAFHHGLSDVTLTGDAEAGPVV
jgi:hypothetical protein